MLTSGPVTPTSVLVEFISSMIQHFSIEESGDLGVAFTRASITK